MSEARLSCRVTLALGRLPRATGSTYGLLPTEAKGVERDLRVLSGMGPGDGYVVGFAGGHYSCPRAPPRPRPCRPGRKLGSYSAVVAKCHHLSTPLTALGGRVREI